MPTRAPIDDAILSRACGGDGLLMQDVLSLFVAQADAFLIAADAMPSDALAKELHRLKGSALSLGAEPLAAAAATLEGSPRGEREASARIALVAALTEAREYATSLMRLNDCIGLAKTAESR